ncbi:MAG: cysteine desulfurase [Bacilli bacterium]|nr:cysteine desulfurase [Bacilli bacterium]MDD3304711.1 cysteine desulfurase [Bacilli bacterium]MDD4053610.1 cysteine desulfurase [Bacilli bacterium]MDD4411109.1 cysteine desulfurase [Bacilli bacterium]
MNREDFPMLDNEIYYFDNGATTLKPRSVIDAIKDYYEHYGANAHRGDYDFSLKVDKMYEVVREKVKNFINADDSAEIIFTSGATASLNMIIDGFFKYHLKSGDEVLITKAEHASLTLPWFVLAEKIGIVIKYIDLDDKLEVTLDNVKKAMTNKTKVIALAHIPNVVGDIRPIKEISSYAHEQGVYVVVDGAQSVPHTKTDVRELNIDFLAFSGHKMLGPTGIGVLYGKYDLLNELKPLFVGGGMNSSFTSLNEYELKSLPWRLEAGTPNIAGVIGLGAAIDYINSIGIDKITLHDQKLKKYAIDKLRKLNNIELYNPDTKGGIVAFNVKGVFSQDTAVYLNKYKICVRAGNHCAKLLKDNLGINNTCRLSFYLYNAKEEIDYLVNVLNNDKILEESL